MLFLEFFGKKVLKFVIVYVMMIGELVLMGLVYLVLRLNFWELGG